MPEHTASERAASERATSDIGAEPLLIVLGPTAVGKESAGVYAALVLGAELIVADSVKPYRGLPIAAAAPPPEHASRVPHHLVGCLDPSERLHAARWVRWAEQAITDVRARRKIPLVVGGTALYLKALLFGLFDGPTADPELRAELRATEAEEPGTLHTRLRDLDPVAAERIHPNDLKRVVRALEVHAATGQPISEIQQQWVGAPRVAYRAVGIRRSREDLRTRIERRIAHMVERGLVDEIMARVEADDLGPTACEAIGVKELVPLVRDRLAGNAESPDALPTALEAIRAHTWQLARRQMNWWKRFPDVMWIDAAPDDDAQHLGARVAARLTDSA